MPVQSESLGIRPISQVAADLGLTADEFCPYGEDKGKIRLSAIRGGQSQKGKLVLVTAMSPSPAGEGKTTTTVGLANALRQRGHRAVAAVREPSMGPVFGSKGGGAGAGLSQLHPADTINLHFTGDIHAITSANNLLSAVLDNHLHFGNQLRLDVRRISWQRVMDMNDRALRSIVVGLGGRTAGVPREDRFDITAASEVMAILALARDYADLQRRLGNVVVGFDLDGKPVQAAQLKAQGAQAVILKDALMPNLVQTQEGTPAIVHCGPFANIAHGTSSVVGTQIALERADLVIQEAGFGSDLGAEKFLDIFCRELGTFPSVAVLVVSVRALKYHGGKPARQLQEKDLEALKAGLCNAFGHLELMAAFGLPVVVALNTMDSDSPEELETVVRELGQKAPTIPIRIFQEGGAGALELADTVARLAATPAKITPMYAREASLADKIEAIATRVYGASRVDYAPAARTRLAEFEALGYGQSYVCMAKTQYSFSDDPKRLGRPRDFALNVREVRLSAGAGFVVAVAGDMMTMPGLSREPNLEVMKLHEDGSVKLS